MSPSISAVAATSAFARAHGFQGRVGLQKVYSTPTGAFGGTGCVSVYSDIGGMCGKNIDIGVDHHVSRRYVEIIVVHGRRPPPEAINLALVLFDNGSWTRSFSF